MGYAITKGGDDYFIDFLGRIKNTFFDDVEKLKRLYAVYSNPIEYSTYNYGDYFDEDIGVSMQKFITTYYYGYLAMLIVRIYFIIQTYCHIYIKLML